MFNFTARKTRVTTMLYTANRRHGVVLVAILGAMIMLTACLPIVDEDASANPDAGAITDPAQEALIAQASADLADQLGVDVDAIELTSIEAVEWGDSSLGCPEEGMMYAAVITPGYRITLTHDGNEYVYHTGADADGPVINCTEDEATSTPSGGAELVAGSTEAQLVALAKEDLATLLDVDADTIETTSVEAMEWTDSSLGCPQEGMMYAQVITPGYQIVLTVDGVDYVYHTGTDVNSPVIGCTDGEAASTPSADAEPVAGSTEAQLVALAKDDLATLLGVDADTIETTSVEATEWTDSSLGCPQEGMMYAQMITPGYQIMLTVDGVDYVYHTGADADSPVINCTGDEAASTPEMDAEPVAGSLVALAKADLAALLSLDANTIETTSVEAVEWSDSSLGCAEAGAVYLQVITPGFQIILSVDGSDYAYHTGESGDAQVKYCESGQN